MDGIEARMFDLLILKAQLRHLKGEDAVPMSFREKVSGIAALLEDKETIPAVKEQLAYICSIKEEEFWHGMGLEQLEELRIRMRNLVQFIDKRRRDIVYTDFEDEIDVSSGDDVTDLPRMAGTEYERKVKEFIDAQSDQLAIQKLKQNEPLTPTDLQDLEDKLRSIGEEDGERLLNGLLERHEAPTLPHFIRTLVGLERGAAQAAFSQFLENDSLSSQQIRFVELIVDQLTANGVMGSRALYEPPFVGLHAGGPEGMFEGKEKIIDGIFDALKNTEPVVNDAVG
jgi:type I restriction enzyme R subunit